MRAQSEMHKAYEETEGNRKKLLEQLHQGILSMNLFSLYK